jgi:hypothetical protein
MKYYIIKTETGYVGQFYRNPKTNSIDAVRYTNDGLLAIKCPIRDIWYQEKLRLEIEDYLESKNIPYEIYILDYNINFYYKPELSEDIE